MLFSSLKACCRLVAGRFSNCSLCQQRYARVILAALCLIAFVWIVLVFENPTRTCLVVYSWNVTDSTHVENFAYFLKEGVISQPGVQFWILLQGNQRPHLPPLPPNAKYIVLPRPCQPWGALRWVAEEHRRFPRYGYYIMVDSAVQGPFMAPYAKRAGSWVDGLLDRITDQVKLVGAVISCDIAVLPGSLDDAKLWRFNPHVDAHVMATDRVGLQVLMSRPEVTTCYQNADKAAYHVEAGGSLGILEAGFSLDCLMLKYQGLDWRNRDHWDCNGRISPIKSHHYDGISLDPFEVMFVRMELPDHSRTSYTFNAVESYKRWQQADSQGSPAALAVNHVLERPMQHKLGHVCHLLTRTATCFDFDYYRTTHSDLATISSARMLWVHFLFYGQFEARMHRFNCTATYWGALDV